MVTRLEARFERFIREEVEQGRFRSEDEVLAAALELLEERERRLAELRAAIARAEQPGVPAETAKTPEF